MQEVSLTSGLMLVMSMDTYGGEIPLEILMVVVGMDIMILLEIVVLLVLHQVTTQHICHQILVTNL